MRRNGRQPNEGRLRSNSFDMRLRIEHLWMLVPVMIVVWIGFIHPVRPLDFWWHLKVGEVIVTSAGIPSVDLFSFTREGQPFVYQNWLGEVLYYLTYLVGGFPLLIASNALLLVLALAPILHLCLEAGRRLHVGVLCSLVAAITLGFFGSMRPQVYSFVLFSVFYWILWQYRDGRRDGLWALPLLMVIWVNLHGAFVLGIGLTALVLATEAVRRTTCGPTHDTLGPAELQKLALVLVLILLASLFNPWGYRVYAYVRQLQVDPASQQYVAEWQVPDITEIAGMLTFFVPLFLAVMVFFYSGSRLHSTELGLFLTFAVFGFTALRNGIWFALLLPPMLARHMTKLKAPNPMSNLHRRVDLGDLTRRVRRVRPGSPRTGAVLNWVILIALLLFTIILSPWVRPRIQKEQLSAQWIDKRTPVRAMDFIEAHQLKGNIFHPQMYGDYLIWRLWPQQRTFIDGRVHLYDESFVRDYFLTFDDAGWESLLAKYDIQYLLLPKDDESSKSMIEDAFSSENWTLLYEDNLSVLFGKRLAKAV